MGVPSLYRWLTMKYPEIKRRIYPDSNFYADNLYLDFNAIVHPCCNKELSSMKQTEKQLYSNLERYLDRIIDLVKPKRLVYIAIDGVAPRAKLNQQRSRRFVKAKESIEKGEEYFGDSSEANVDDTTKNKVFDVNAITPGTKFMDRLDKFLKELIKSKLSADPRWNRLNVIYSNYKVPGEGEQKIMEYIRKHQSPRLRHVIYSPDADLIFLGLTLYEYNVFIMREEFKKATVVDTEEELKDPMDTDLDEAANIEEEITINSYEDKDFALVDIQRLKGLLINDFRAVIKRDLDNVNFLRDWVLLCFSVGNDFLPCAPCFEIRTNAIEKITAILLTVYKRTGRCITNGRKINFDILKEFFIECSRHENDFLIEKSRNLVVSRARMQLPYDPQAEFATNCNSGKVRFYVEKMDVKSEDELLVACKEYIRGFVWIYNYYFYEVPSWEWYYPYHYAPFMCDLARVSNISVSFNLSRPLRAFEQLLSVLPPASRWLIPQPLHDIFDINKDQYPMEFKVDMFQKVMDWQAVVVLPFIDVQTVRQDYSARQNLLSYEDMDRNTIGYALFYSAHPIAISKAKNIYSNGRAFEILNLEGINAKVFPLNNIDDAGSSSLFQYKNRTVVFSFDQRIVAQPARNAKAV